MPREAEFKHARVVNDLQDFKQLADVFVANRLSEELCDVHP
jgi:UDPglucose 6-dehydrogenase